MPDDLSDKVRGMNEQWAFIERTATALGVGREAVRKWRTRGVSHQWRLPIIEIAQAAKFPLDRAVFDSKPGSKRAAENGAAE